MRTEPPPSLPTGTLKPGSSKIQGGRQSPLFSMHLILEKSMYYYYFSFTQGHFPIVFRESRKGRGGQENIGVKETYQSLLSPARATLARALDREPNL